MAHAEEPRPATKETSTENPPAPVTSTENPPTPVSATNHGGGFGFFNLALTAAIALACGLGGAYLFARYFGGHSLDAHGTKTTVTETAAQGPATGTNHPAGREPRAPTPAETSDRIDDLKSQLSNRKKRVDDKDKPVVPPEVTALQVRTASIAETTDTLAPLRVKSII